MSPRLLHAGGTPRGYPHTPSPRNPAAPRRRDARAPRVCPVVGARAVSLTGVGFLSPCVPSFVSAIRTPRSPLLPLWEKGVGGMRGKSALESRKSRIAPKKSTLERGSVPPAAPRRRDARAPRVCPVVGVRAACPRRRDAGGTPALPRDARAPRRVCHLRCEQVQKGWPTALPHSTRSKED